MSFQISITPSRRAAARFIGSVRDLLLRSLADSHVKTGLTQSDIARTIDVHRSVINRELRGRKDITLGRIAELAFAMGLEPRLQLLEAEFEQGTNISTDNVMIRSNTTANLVRSSGSIGGFLNPKKQTIKTEIQAVTVS